MNNPTIPLLCFLSSSLLLLPLVLSSSEPTVTVTVTAAAAAAAGNSNSNTTPLDHLCNNLGGFYITPDYCFTAFAADSRSRTADYNFLALISLNLTISNATNVRSTINSMLTSTTFSSTTSPSSESVHKGLQTCFKLYDDVISSLRWSAQSVSAGRYDGAKAVVEQAVSVPASCDAMPGLPLSKENDGFSRIALLSQAVVSYLAN